MDELRTLATAIGRIPRHEDETAAGDEIEAWLRSETAATVTRDEAPGGGNVIARRGSGEPTIALVGHHDVVPPAAGQVRGDQYQIERREGRLYGRGMADMTGALAAQLLAFRDADPDCEIIVASFTGEETGGTGARWAINAGFSPDYAVVGEGSTNYSATGVTDVAIAQRGLAWQHVRATGESTHAATPQEGANAIYRLCDAIEAIRSLDSPTATIAGETVSGSVAVTGIEGGDEWNVVPDEAVARVDERTVPGEPSTLEPLKDRDAISVEPHEEIPPVEPPAQPFIDLALNAAEHAQEGAPQAVVKPHATDAGHLAGAGVDCLVCGPAEPGEAHTDSESVSIIALERCYRIYSGILDAFPKAGSQ